MSSSRSILLVAIVLLSASQALPLYGWSQVKVPGVEAKKELTTSEDCSNILTELFEADSAFSAILYKRPGMSTTDLADHLSNSYPLINKIFRNSKRQNVERSCLNADSSTFDALIASVPEIATFHINSEDQFKYVIESIETTPKPFINKVFVIEVPMMENEEFFDLMVANIEKAFELRSYGKHFSAIIGTSLMKHERRSLQGIGEPVEAMIEPADLQPTYLLSKTKAPRIGDVSSTYLTPVVLLGVMLGLVLVFALISALLTMFDLQTPTSFVKTSIDWGKIEK